MSEAMTLGDEPRYGGIRKKGSERTLARDNKDVRSY